VYCSFIWNTVLTLSTNANTLDEGHLLPSQQQNPRSSQPEEKNDMRRTVSRFHNLTLIAMALIAVAMVPTNIYANALIYNDGGILQIGNMNSTVVGVTSNAICINWAGAATCATPGATHQMNIGGGGSAIFATGLSASDTIRDVSSFPGPIVVGFETVVGAGLEAGNIITFDLTQITQNGGSNIGTCSGAAANAAFNSCVPAFSPFSFQENGTATGVSISFSVLKNGYTCANGVAGTAGGCNSSNTSFTPYSGTFSTQINGSIVGLGSCNGVTANITSILTCESTGGTIQATWSATESPTVPEPMTIALIGSGLIGLALFGRRRLRRS